VCYAIPGKIVKINGDYAVIDYGGVTKSANLSLLDNPGLGDYILIHAGFAIEKLDQQSAEESIKIIENHIKKVDNG